MIDRPNDPRPARLPSEWLPEAHPPQDSPVWELQVARIMAAADAELGSRESAVVPAPPSSWTLLGQWWKPAALLAAAATALLIFVDAPAPATSGGSLSLSVVAADGDPLALWGAAEAPPHPVLALIASEPGLQEEDR